MSSVLTRLMTAEEFFEWTHLPKNRDRHFELEQREVVELPRADAQHERGVVCANSAYLLVSYIRSIKKGHVTTNDTDIVLERDPATVRGADIALYLDKVKFQDLKVKYSDRLPRLIVEALSPNDRQGGMQKRINQFLDKRVAMAWLLDPDAETLTIFLPNRQPIVLEKDEEVKGLKALPGFACPVADFFANAGD